MEKLMTKQHETEANSLKEPVVAPGSPKQLEPAATEPETASVPQRPANQYEMRRYYDENKDAILADLAALGEVEMRRKWNISQATWKTTQRGTIVGLAVRWGLAKPDKEVNSSETKWTKHETKTLKSGTASPSSDTKVFRGDPQERHIIVHVYQLADGWPPFEKCSTSESQAEWLRCYRDLALHGAAIAKTNGAYETTDLSPETIKEIAGQIAKARKILAERVGGTA
jgi:hypothetical protein